MSTPLTVSLGVVGESCPHEGCSGFGRRDGRIVKFGKSRQGRQRYRCEDCGKCFNERTGTLFYGKRTAEATIVEVLSMVAEGMRISSISRVKGLKEDTILQWVREAGGHAEAVEAALLADYELGASQLDGLWTFVHDKGEKKSHEETEATGQFWRVTVVENETRLRAARATEKTESQASEQVLRTLCQRGHPEQPPPLVSDGGSGCGEAMIEVYGQVPADTGQGRPPVRKQPDPAWQYLRAVKQRDAKGRYIGTDYRVVFGEPDEVLDLLGSGTVYVERTHLTMRHFNGRLVRKGLGFSKDLTMHRLAAAFEDAVYNLVRPVKTLRQKAQEGLGRRWWPRTPMMAAGLTDRPWTLRDLLTAIPVLKPINS